MEDDKRIYGMEEGGSYYLNSPRTPPDSPPLESINIDFDDYEDFLDKDLRDLDDIFGSLSRIPSMDKLQMQTAIYPNATQALEVHSTMTAPYFRLQFVGCIILYSVLCNNYFIEAIINNSESDNIFSFLVIRAINMMCIGFFTYIFTSPDTFKSTNLTLACLLVNTIIYEYRLLVFLQYFSLHIIAGFVASALVTTIYYDILVHIQTETLLNHIFPFNKKYDFGYSFVLVVIMSHFCLAVGLTMITNMTTSLNARKRAIHKACFKFFISILFGVVVGPIGYTLAYLSLYITIAVIRNEFNEIDKGLLIVQSITIFSMLILYPFVAIQIKFVWRNKYRRYIEYGM